MKKYLFFFITFYLLQTLSSAQDKNETDSLLSVIAGHEENEAKVDAYNKLCWEFNGSEPTRAIEYGQAGLELAKKLNYKAGIAVSYNNIGVVYSIQSNYPKGLEYFLKALSAREDVNDKKGMAQTTNNIGVLYKNIKEYDLALEKYLYSLKIKEELNDTLGIARTFNNIAEIYILQKKFKDAIDYQNKSLQLNTSLGYLRDVASSLSNLSEIYKQEAKYKQALDYSLRSLETERKIGNRIGEAISMGEIAELYVKTGDSQKALSYAEEGLKIADELNIRDIKQLIYFTLSSVYAALNNYKKAYEYSSLSSAEKDSLYDEEKTQQIAEAQNNYEIDKREKEITLLKKDAEIQSTQIRIKNIINYSLAAGLILIILFALYYYKSNLRIKKANNLLEIQKKEILLKSNKLEELNTEMKNLMFVVAHDLKSPLAAIKNFVEFMSFEEEKLSGDQKESLESISKISDDGIKFIEDLLNLQTLEEKLQKIKIEEIDINNLIKELLWSFKSLTEKKNTNIIFETVEENLIIRSDKNYLKQIFSNLISNAIKYSPFNETVKIKVEEKGKNLEFSVEDNGQGFSEEDKKNVFLKFQKLSAQPTGGESSSGFGLAISKTLTEKLNGSIKLESEVFKGSKFIVSLPLL